MLNLLLSTWIIVGFDVFEKKYGDEAHKYEWEEQIIIYIVS